jgi:hypothetical protein
MNTFRNRIRPSVQAELAAAGVAEAQGELPRAFAHLERAHVLGQAATLEHVRVHWHMFRFALRHRLHEEAGGQLWRILQHRSSRHPDGCRKATPEAPASAASSACPFRQTSRRHWTPLAAESHAQERTMTRFTPVFAALAATAFLAAGCMTQPKDLDLSTAKSTAAGAYRVELVAPAQPPAINQMHSWKVKLAAPDGTPVRGAQFAVDGGMPQHGHGLPTQPRVTRELEAGVYALDGMKFSMTGWWEVKLDIQGPRGADKVTFNTVVNAPSVKQ